MVNLVENQQVAIKYRDEANFEIARTLTSLMENQQKASARQNDTILELMKEQQAAYSRRDEANRESNRKQLVLMESHAEFVRNLTGVKKDFTRRFEIEADPTVNASSGPPTPFAVAAPASASNTFPMVAATHVTVTSSTSSDTKAAARKQARKLCGAIRPNSMPCKNPRLPKYGGGCCFHKK